MMIPAKTFPPKDWTVFKGEIRHVIMKGNRIVILGFPDDNDESHDCDEMQCTSVMHKLLDGYISTPNNKNLEIYAGTYPVRSLGHGTCGIRLPTGTFGDFAIYVHYTGDIDLVKVGEK